MKKLIVIALSAILALSLVACGSHASVNDGTQATNGKALGDDSMQIPNPFVDCSTLEDAQKLADFSLNVPKNMPEGYSMSAIRAIESKMIELVFTNGGDEIRIRKSTGSEDTSGDYNVYKENNTTIVGNVQVTLKGNEGKVNVATWIHGNYAFAITVNPGGAGMDSTVISDMVSSIQ